MEGRLGRAGINSEPGCRPEQEMQPVVPAVTGRPSQRATQLDWRNATCKYRVE
jgi:hypothetical protein